MAAGKVAERAMEQGRGILRLAPAWVPRKIFVPGRRLKLHPDDLYALGEDRGGMDERWFASTTAADNGPKTAPDEGLNRVVMEDGGNVEDVLLRDAVETLKGGLVGERIWEQYHSWPAFAKFFDNQGPLPFHIHQQAEHAARIGQMPKPEAYYFPAQVNGHSGDFPYTYLGLRPGTTKEEFREHLEAFTKGDNRITELSTAHRQKTGTGWDVPAGMAHGPGSLCTYEPQMASDVFAIFQSVVGGKQVMPEEYLWHGTPEEELGNFDYLVGLLDWEKNVDPDLLKNRFMQPVPVRPLEEMQEDGCVECWICYRSSAASAKELTVLPGRTVTLQDGAAYGIIMLEGRGKMGVWDIDSPDVIRYGQLTSDEFFISEEAARGGVKVTNLSSSEPLVMLKHFGPGNPDLEKIDDPIGEAGRGEGSRR